MSCGLDICYCQSNSIIYNILYCFNTSHVTLYRILLRWTWIWIHVSIHLMLLFIRNSIRRNLRTTIRFNTSHVTLYRHHQCHLSHDRKVSIHLMLLFIDGLRTVLWVAGWFQYISCYSLSGPAGFMIGSNYEFQYISCYSLSCGKELPKDETTLFQYISCYSLSIQTMMVLCVQPCFNTSHVTLYLLSNRQLRSCVFVSIHLMLLFIEYINPILWSCF